MSRTEFPCARGPLGVAVLIVLALATGCSEGIGKTHSVNGKVTIDGSPLTAKSTVITLIPDKSKGNNTPYEPAATVDSSGNYTVYTKNQRGAPPGWYKVVVTAVGEPAPPATTPLKQRPAPKSLVPPRYGQASTTPLEIEVVASPASGAYDLKLSQ